MPRKQSAMLFEPLENRVLLNADLTGVFSDNLPDTSAIQPGAELAIPVIITNDGDANATGAIDLELFVSLDDALSANDRSVATLDNQAVNLDPGQSQQFIFNVVVPDRLPAGTGFLLGEITVNNGIVEDDSNNVIDKNESGEAVTGTVGKPGKLTLQIEDDDGTTITITLSGNGSMQVVDDEDTGESDLVVVGTDIRSKLTVKTRGGDGRAEVRDIIVGNPDDEADRTNIGQIVATTTDLTGDATITGFTKRFSLGDVAEDHHITIGPSDDARSSVFMSFRDITDLIVDTAVGIKKFLADSWTRGVADDDELIAPWITTLQVKGDFEADMTLSGEGAGTFTLKSAKISGNIGSGDADNPAVYDVTGDINAFDASKGTTEGLTFNVHSQVKKLTLGVVEDADITVGDLDAQNKRGDIGKLQVGQWNAGSVTAGSITSLITRANSRIVGANGDWRGDITLTGPGAGSTARNTLNSAKIARNLGSGDGDNPIIFDLTGDIGKLDASKGTVEGFQLDLHSSAKDIKLGVVEQADLTIGDLDGNNRRGHLNKLSASQWNHGTVLAGTLGTLQTRASTKIAGANGDWRDDIILTGSSNLTETLTLKTVKIAGSVVDTLINILAGNLKSFTAGLMQDSAIRLGVSDGVANDELVDDAGDFDANAGALEKFTIKGLRGADRSAPSFINSIVQAFTIGKASLKVIQTDNTANANAPFGFAATSIAGFAGQNDDATKLPKLTKLVDQQTIIDLLGVFDLEDFVLRVVA